MSKIFLLKVHVNLALYHTVVEFSSLVGTFSEQPFKVLRRTYDVISPAAFTDKLLTHGFVDVICRFYVKKAFTVRRVTDNRALFGFTLPVMKVKKLKLNSLVNSGTSCVFPGNFKTVFVDITAVRPKVTIKAYKVLSTRSLFGPDLCGNTRKLFRGKSPLQSRRYTESLHGTFYEYGSRAAHGVIKSVITSNTSK